MDIEQARFNMVEQQIRPWRVNEPRVLELIRAVPREAFVPDEQAHLAFVDTCVPLAHEQVMMRPREEARCLQALAIKPSDTILEIGTGSGFVTALLAHLGRHVTSVDIFPDFVEQAATRLHAQNINNVSLEVGDAAQGWPQVGHIDAVFITGSLWQLPEGMLDQLNPGGRLVAILGEAPAMTATLITKDAKGHVQKTGLFETDTPRLINAEEPDAFVF